MDAGEGVVDTPSVITALRHLLVNSTRGLLSGFRDINCVLNVAARRLGARHDILDSYAATGVGILVLINRNLSMRLLALTR